MASAPVMEPTTSASAALTERLEPPSAQEEATQSTELQSELCDATQYTWAAADAAQPAEDRGDASQAPPPPPPAGAVIAAQQVAQSARQQDRHVGASVSVGFQPPSESAATRSEATATTAAAPSPTRTFCSAWRWPEERGKLPPYVQRAFRLKAFSLVFAQLSLCLAGSVAVKEMHDRDLVARAMMSPASLWIFCAASVLSILLLYHYRHAYPASYLLLVLNTASITLTWSFGGMSGVLFEEEAHLHLQVLGALVIAVLVTALVGHALSIRKVESDMLVPASFLVGWLAGAAANLVFVSAMEGFEGSPFAAAGIAFMLYGIVLIDVGALLVSGNPDGFMRVVISCDSTLLVIASIPLLLLSFCLVRSYQETDQRERQPARDRRPPLPH